MYCTKCCRERAEDDFYVCRKSGKTLRPCKECKTAYRARYRQENLEKCRSLVRRNYYREKEGSPDGLRAKHRAKRAIYRARHRAEIRVSNRRRNSAVASAGGDFTNDDWKRIQAAQEFRCLACLRREPEIVLTIDHVIPIANGGRDDKWNIQGLCGSCNSSKGATHADYRPAEWNPFPPVIS